MPHGHCYLWRPDVVWLHVTADALIAAAYFVIPALLIHLVRRRGDLSFNWMFWMFSAFILLCGTTHLFSIVTLWSPIYRLEGLLKLATGVVSVATAIALIPLIPKLVSIPSSSQLATANDALAEQIRVNQRAHADLQLLNSELEHRVAERTAELQRSNQDLAQFAYVASHDLQEPLRMVSTYTFLLKKRYGPKLDEEAQTFIGFAADGAARMSQLITDLLAYAQIDNRDSSQMKEVDASVSLNSALTTLRLTIEQQHAEIEVGALPTVRADGSQLSLIFQNLIGNSLKYRKEERPHVRIWAEQIEDGKSWKFYVSDNGIGFDMRFKDRLFKMFQRLDHERPGTGIGLAICKKIIQRHGGSVDVDSQLGVGTTFFFTLPATSSPPSII